MSTKRKKRVAAVITEYWEISHADMIITRILEGFILDGNPYTSSLELVSMYVDQFPQNDMSRDMSRKHNVPIFPSIAEALKRGGETFDLDGIVIVGEHGDYPENELRQTLYPRRRFFEECLNVMLEAGRIVPVFSDKGYAVVQEDVEWMYQQIKRHQIPFMSSSVVPFARQYPGSLPPPNGSPLHKMFGFSYDNVGDAPERYVYHTLEMMQSIAENRMYGESGIRSVKTYEGNEAIDRLFGPVWNKLYRKLGGFINLMDLNRFPYILTDPVLIEVSYADGLLSGILHADHEVIDFVSAYQMYEDSEPYCTEFFLQPGKPYSHFGRLMLEIERFIHTARPSYPVERSLLTTGALDAVMRSLYEKREIETPHLLVCY